jgi:hypothetical protein
MNEPLLLTTKEQIKLGSICTLLVRLSRNPESLRLRHQMSKVKLVKNEETSGARRCRKKSVLLEDDDDGWGRRGDTTWFRPELLVASYFLLVYGPWVIGAVMMSTSLFDWCNCSTKNSRKRVYRWQFICHVTMLWSFSVQLTRQRQKSIFGKTARCSRNLHKDMEKWANEFIKAAPDVNEKLSTGVSFPHRSN